MFLQLSHIPQSLIESYTVSSKNVKSDFITQSYSPVLEIVEHRVDKEQNIMSDFLIQLYSPVLDKVEHSVDKEGNIGFFNSVSGDKNLNKADPLSAYRQILAT